MPNAMLQSLLTTSKYIINSEMGTRGCKQGKFWSLWFSWFYLVWIFIFCLLAFYLTVWSFRKKSIFCIHFRHCTIFTKRRQIKLDRVRGKSTVGEWCFGGIVEFKVYVILVVQNLTPNVLVWAFVQFRPVWFFGVGTSPPDGLPLNKHQWREAVPKKKKHSRKGKDMYVFRENKKQHIFDEISCELNVHAQVIPNCLNSDFKLCI